MPDTPAGTPDNSGAVETESLGGPAGALASGGPHADNQPGGKERSGGSWASAWRELKFRPIFWISAVIILIVLLMAIVPGMWTSASPTAGNPSHYLGTPQLAHFFQADWFGYDQIGRSVYSRVVHGARASIIVGIFTTLGVTVAGILLGMLAGFFGGWLDAVISRLTDIVFSIPLLLGAMVMLQAFTQRTAWTVTLVLVTFGWTQITRVMRGSVITVKQADYVQAARALGAGNGRLMFKHVLPNAIAPVIVVATISLGMYISAEATLSYLGIGIQSGISWGSDISDASEQIRNAIHLLLFPAGFLSATVLAFIMLGDAVRDALDPKLR
ncbi:peptide ABC transporter permease [Mangrovactinospora gilvigrisea]|uniref:Peptide ABC transporter permease n=1 Tax=Mangrovactinospora gilvigrisea TaxID=1428644 RepID=A0A1J7C749_9ACTN|nr:ABC transporter permease [Mangrovactinospora gilvigrisea]OIV37356.1 peptide ABC transporter permease [Mangrovactinospora gilvigrisea]